MMLSSCSPVKPLPPSCSPTRFKEIAVPTLANNLFNQVKKMDWRTNVPLVGGNKKSFAVDLFTEETTGTWVKASREILRIVLEQAKKNFAGFTVDELTTSNSKSVDYFITGVIRYEPLCNAATGATKKFRSVESSVIERKTGSKVAEYKVWIQDESAVDTTRVEGGPVQSELETDSLTPEETVIVLTELVPLLNEAETASEKGDYDKAVQRFEKASKVKTDQKQVRIYNGLYWSYFKLGRRDKAAQAMGKLVKAAAKENSLSFYFLFKPDSYEDFVSDKWEEYDIWIQQIGEHFGQTQECLQIMGHTSKTGTPEHNCILSKNRATTIQSKLRDYYPQVDGKTIPVGRGDSDCKSCAEDDNIATVDRRVEFKIVNCENLRNIEARGCNDLNR